MDFGYSVLNNLNKKPHLIKDAVFLLFNITVMATELT